MKKTSFATADVLTIGKAKCDEIQKLQQNQLKRKHVLKHFERKKVRHSRNLQWDITQGQEIKSNYYDLGFQLKFNMKLQEKMQVFEDDYAKFQADNDLLTKQLNDCYCKLLKQPQQNKKGIVWIVKSLLQIKGELNKGMLPPYLNSDQSLEFLKSRAELELDLEELEREKNSLENQYLQINSESSFKNKSVKQSLTSQSNVSMPPKCAHEYLDFNIGMNKYKQKLKEMKNAQKLAISRISKDFSMKPKRAIFNFLRKTKQFRIKESSTKLEKISNLIKMYEEEGENINQIELERIFHIFKQKPLTKDNLFVLTQIFDSLFNPIDFSKIMIKFLALKQNHDLKIESQRPYTLFRKTQLKNQNIRNLQAQKQNLLDKTFKDNEQISQATSSFISFDRNKSKTFSKFYKSKIFNISRPSKYKNMFMPKFKKIQYQYQIQQFASSLSSFRSQSIQPSFFKETQSKIQESISDKYQKLLKTKGFPGKIGIEENSLIYNKLNFLNSRETTIMEEGSIKSGHENNVNNEIKLFTSF